METENSADDSAQSRSRTVETLRSSAEDGSLPLLAGAILFGRALLPGRSRGARVLQALTATALVGIGLRQRKARQQRETAFEAGTGTSEQRAESQQEEYNPRGTAGEPDIETKTDPDEGSLQFTEDQTEEVGTRPDLDEPAPDDPRLEGESETTEVNLSEAAMADEASEAVGPAPEQAQPTQTDATEPEEMPEEDAGAMEVDDSLDEADETEPDHEADSDDETDEMGETETDEDAEEAMEEEMEETDEDKDETSADESQEEEATEET